MDVQFYESKIDQIDLLAREDRYAEALEMVEHLLERYPLSPYLLVRRGLLIQLYSGVDHPMRTLDVARESFEMACTLAPDYAQALIELGHFQYAIEDKADEGLRQFQIAREQAENDLQEALIGETKCYLDVGQPDRAHDAVERLLAIFPDNQEAVHLRTEVIDLLEREGTTDHSQTPD